MFKENRTARLQGAMALVASATAELQRLKPPALRAADIVTKATTHTNSPKVTRSAKPISSRRLTVELKGRCKKSKAIPSAATATTPQNLAELLRFPNTFLSRGLMVELKSRGEKSKLTPPAAKAASPLRRLRRG